MSGDRLESPPVTGGGNGVVLQDKKTASVMVPSQRLRLHPNKDHMPESYEDLQLDFSPSVFRSLEKYLPPNMLSDSRENKVKFMRDILLKYLPHGERTRAQKHREYRQRIISHYKSIHLLKVVKERENAERLGLSEDGSEPLKRELFSMHPVAFFVPSFMKAINDNTEESLRSIISEPSPGILTFEMLQPRFCELLVAEVENFEAWVNDTKFRIMRPNTMNKYGAVLDDFGLETMLDKLMNGFIRPISKGDTYVLIPDKLHHMFPGNYMIIFPAPLSCAVFFREVGGANLDSHHGFVVEYGKDWDVDLGFHVDDSEVTLNVCLGKQFSGGELFFRGTRCDKHVNTGSKPEEIFDYSHVPGRAVLHLGRHRHGVRATTAGHRINLLLWCKSSVFREIRKYQKDFSSWCGECAQEKKGRQRAFITARSYSGRMVSP
ncbi:2-oxoglutarate and iron-dependent oxygenase domain-containing protein CP2-like isoform X1 [Populus alba x Populus x berolinensis]|nr:2-oxoglutarate and iron-dependent oxygenase domain-containing protein CP2-like isoform X1 [Populus alba x Populus x berolinensis]